MECPICLEEYDDAQKYVCEVCKTALCLQCLQSLKKEECPFCRLNFSTSLPSTPLGASFPTQHTQSQSLPLYTATIPDWERSRILTRQLRRERKRQDHEQQQIRNAEISRLHNLERRMSRQPKSRQERRNDLMFDIELDR